MLTTYAVLAGFILDLLIGDPGWIYHPVRLIGKLIEAVEKHERRRRPDSPEEMKKAGLVLVITVLAVTDLCVFALLMIGYHIGRVPGFIVEMLLCWWLFAVKDLRDESMRVCDRLKVHDLQGARKAVSMIVGRDTDNLTEEGVAKAAVETVAENTGDGVITPLFYMVIGGPLLGWLAKAVNTMDSMVGYRNDRYLYFGRYAAKLDDAVNYIPARLAAVMMTLSCLFCHLDAKNAWKIFRRDRYNHASPNSAQCESVMAGALHVQLAGDAYYFGSLVKKKTIGDPDRAVQPDDIIRADSLLYVTSFLSTAVFLAVRTAVILLV